jgi:hypothetical protein
LKELIDKGIEAISGEVISSLKTEKLTDQPENYKLDHTSDLPLLSHQTETLYGHVNALPCHPIR